ncbi:MAG: ThuA domain-containing protein [Limisphaerales bacterium]
MKNLLLTALFALSAVFAEAAKPKVVFISGKPSHGPMSHEHRAGNLILAKRLNASGLANAVVLPDIGYPEDSSVLKDADTIVIFCTGHGGHVLNPKLKEFDALMKKGVGVVMIHWTTEAVKGEPGEKFLQWMGGFCDLDWSVNPHWIADFKPQKHEIWNGVKRFKVNDEWYYHMRFVKDRTGLTPILTDLPGPETLKRPNGPRSGNVHVRRSVANGESQHVAWAYQRQGMKGRGFGFTGGHVHMNWQNDNYRKIVLNAILWTAGVNVPKNGVPSATPSDAEMRSNLDDKKKRAPRRQAKPSTASKPAAKNEPPPSFDQLRQQAIKRLDSRKSLNLLTKSLNTTKNPKTQAALMQGMVAGLAGQRNVPAPAGWGQAMASLSKSSNADVVKYSLRLGQIFGVKAATQQAIAAVKNTKASADVRRSALQSLVTQRSPEVKGLLPSLLNDKALQVDAIRAYGAIEDNNAPKQILKRYASLDFQAKRATVETLASRKNYAQQLLGAIKNKTVPKQDIPTYLARNLSQLLGKSFDRAFGKIDSLSQDKAALINKYRKLLDDKHMAKGDPQKGRQMFELVCASCHQIYGKGAHIGPDLTGSNRGDIDYILLNMIDPSADVPDAYKSVTINTRDGQVLVGTLAAEDGQRVVLNTVGQKLTVLKSDIKTRTVSKLSMMPEGLLPALSDSQVIDLVKYLQTKKQVALP